MAINGTIKMGNHNLDIFLADLRGELFEKWKSWYKGINGTGKNVIRVNTSTLVDYSVKIRSNAMQTHFQHLNLA